MALPYIERKVALIRSGRTLLEIAAELGFTAGHVGEVFRGNRRHAETEQAIADAIGIPVEQVFAPRETHVA